MIVPFSNRSLDVLDRVLAQVGPQLETQDLLVVSRQMRFPGYDRELVALCKPHRAIIVTSRSAEFNVSRARNSGVYFAKHNQAQIAQCLDADVLLPEGYLAQARRRCLGGPATVYPRVVRRGMDHSGLGLGCAMFRIRDWFRVRGYDESWLETGEDGDFLLRVSTQLGVHDVALEVPPAVHLDHPEVERPSGSERQRRRFELKLPEDQSVNPGPDWGTYVVVQRP